MYTVKYNEKKNMHIVGMLEGNSFQPHAEFEDSAIAGLYAEKRNAHIVMFDLVKALEITAAALGEIMKLAHQHDPQTGYLKDIDPYKALEIAVKPKQEALAALRRTTYRTGIETTAATDEIRQRQAQ